MLDTALFCFAVSWMSDLAYGKILGFGNEFLGQLLGVIGADQLCRHQGKGHKSHESQVHRKPLVPSDTVQNQLGHQCDLHNAQQSSQNGMTAVKISAAGDEQGAQLRLKSGFELELAGGAVVAFGIQDIGATGAEAHPGIQVARGLGFQLDGGQQHFQFFSLFSSDIGKLLLTAVFIFHDQGAAFEVYVGAILIPDLRNGTERGAVKPGRNVQNALIREYEDGAFEEEKRQPCEHLFQGGDRRIAGCQTADAFVVKEEKFDEGGLDDQLALSLFDPVLVPALVVGKDDFAIHRNAENGERASEYILSLGV